MRTRARHLDLIDIGRGFLCILAGLALCRYAFTPLLPALIEGGWTTQSGGAWLGATNFSGYLLGALVAHWVGSFIGQGRGVLLALCIGVVSLALSGLDLGWWALAIWRILAGVSGGMIFVLVPSLVLSNISHARQDLGSGMIFAGSGAGIVLASLAMPMLVEDSISTAWFALAGGSLVVLVLNLKLVTTRDISLDSPLVMAPQMSSRTRRTVWLVCGAYGLFGIGIVPHTLLLSDYLFEDLGVSIDAASERFAVFGIGSLLGGVLVGGWFARWARASTRLVLASGLAVVSILIVPIAADAITVTVSALTMGTAHMGCVSVMSRRVDELVGLSRHTRYWGRATLWVGGGYASGAAVMAGVLSAGGSYASCFWIAGVAMIGAMGLYIMTSRSLGEQA